MDNRHRIGWLNQIIVRRESHLRRLYSIWSNKSTEVDQLPMSEYGCAHMLAYEEGFEQYNGDDVA